MNNTNILEPNLLKTINQNFLSICDSKISAAHRRAHEAGNTDYWLTVLDRLYNWRATLESKINAHIPTIN